MAIAWMLRTITIAALVLGAQGSNATNSTKPAVSNTTNTTIATKPAVSNVTKPGESNLTKPAVSNTTKAAGSNTTKPAETKPAASNTTKPTGSGTTKPAETKPTVSNATKPAVSNTTKSAVSDGPKPAGSNTTKPAGSNTTKPAESNTTKPAVSNTTKLAGSTTTKPASPTVVKGNIKFGVLMNATEAASFVKDAKVILGVETGIAQKLNLSNVSWVKATLSVVTARRLGAAANGTTNINVDFVITVPATATSAPSASTLEANLKKTDEASKDQWKAALTIEIKKAAPAHANLKVTISSVTHTPVTTPAPRTQLSPSIPASLPHVAGLLVMMVAALI